MNTSIILKRKKAEKRYWKVNRPTVTERSPVILLCFLSKGSKTKSGVKRAESEDKQNVLVGERRAPWPQVQCLMPGISEP